jgi:ABC-type multidrug transport system fused ATPase/permease subunit
VDAGEKVGIVGRTGAGKSSLISCLFRLVDPSSGKIEIDGCDILSLGLHDLRPRISIIPQEPVLFNGNVRRNFDPSDSHQDSEIWDVVKKVNLDGTVKSMPAGLDSEVAKISSWNGIPRF